MCVRSSFNCRNDGLLRSSISQHVMFLLSIFLSFFVASFAKAADEPTLEDHVMPLLKSRCVKCHGPAKREGKLTLATAFDLKQGGKHQPLVQPGNLDQSLLWSRVADDEMPPDSPLAEAEKQVLRRWIEKGARGLPKSDSQSRPHWAFSPLRPPTVPEVRDTQRVRGDIDRFLQSALEAKGITLGVEADRSSLVRRVCFDLTGLPPTIAEIEAFLNDRSPDAYERMLERYLASPRYGERWGKYWLDAAGYADSNGYFDVDTDRPLAYRYRDYVIRAWNDDMPLDRFIREQIAGDELSGYARNGKTNAAIVDQLVATHFLRNGPDGTDDSNGGPDVLRDDRYAVLESSIEILGSALFGLTFQCARCHDHKFEPITQQDYYQLQAIIYPAFPVDQWVNPKERVIDVPLPADIEEWKHLSKSIETDKAKLREDYQKWVDANRAVGTTLFKDDFGSKTPRLAPRWTSSHVGVDSESAPGAVVKDGTLWVIESGRKGDRRLATAMNFDWTPNEVGGWIQATFDLVERKLSAKAKPAERVGYYIALSLDTSKKPSLSRGILLDGNPDGGANVFLNYPGPSAKDVGAIGEFGYEPGKRLGVRITNKGNGAFQLEHLLDGIPEGKSLNLTSADLPDGGFGFEYCCGRSFVVDNLIVEFDSKPAKVSDGKLVARHKEYQSALKEIAAKEAARPGRISWTFDQSPSPPNVHLLKRGVRGDRGDVVEPNVPAILRDSDNPFTIVPPAGLPSTGRRLALARWMTQPGSRASALVARVTANRIWQYHFGVGLAATSENLGYSGMPPTNAALLEHLSLLLIKNAWKAKGLHRAIMTSVAYRQVNASNPIAASVDPENRLLWRFPMRRLDADAMRDAMLATSNEIDFSAGGPYVPTMRAGVGEVQVKESSPGAHRRSVYLQQRRTAVLGLLETFDAPSIVGSCTRRNVTTIPLQSLSLLNSAFVRGRADAFARRLTKDIGNDSRKKLSHAFMLAFGREPTAVETEASLKFISSQPGNYPGRANAVEQSWVDLCQMILASNAFLYVE